MQPPRTEGPRLLKTFIDKEKNALKTSVDVICLFVCLFFYFLGGQKHPEKV